MKILHSGIVVVSIIQSGSARAFQLKMPENFVLRFIASEYDYESNSIDLDLEYFTNCLNISKARVLKALKGLLEKGLILKVISQNDKVQYSLTNKLWDFIKKDVEANTQKYLRQQQGIYLESDYPYS